MTGAAAKNHDSAAVLGVFGELEAMHAWRGWHWWPGKDAFEVAVGAILVQNTAWANVELALAQLRVAAVLDEAAMRALDPERLEALIRPSGQYRQKARKLAAFLALCERHGGIAGLLALPAVELRAELLGTWGIGPETADCIVVYGAHEPAFVVDAYTIRIFRRLGLGPEGEAYDAWQRWFVTALPADADAWARYHALIVLHAKYLCRKLRPRCDDCSLRPRCPGSAVLEAIRADA